MRQLELWGGPECTVNRVGDAFRDQFHASGHHERLSDLDLFAQLGISAIRYPVLWERVAPDRPDQLDWHWSDTRLAKLQSLGIRPILGLVHHGSGPRYTDLLADDFARGLAGFARAVAERYPWVEDWTPVNEPVTTARFSALYGLWYPHCRDERSFWAALINQIDGVRFAMAEIRTVNPRARLIQTDDLGRTYATAAVRDQAAFDNVRRWMGWDLLCGRVVPGHCLWQRLSRLGFGDRLRAISDHPCPPDIIGVNHYLTSDRFLDHRIQRYPEHVRGGNERQRFADTEAVRVLDPPPPGLRGVLREAWQRYGLPLAVTEVHNGCTREEQMRWMADAWAAALELRQEGVDMRAVTSWSLLGSCGWNRLLTEDGLYEPGVYDVSSGTPRPTAMVRLLQDLTREQKHHPVLQGQGWWRRPIRLLHPSVPRPAPMRERPPSDDWAVGPGTPLLLMGAGGTADRILDHCRHRGIAVRSIDSNAPAARDPTRLLDGLQPWGVLALAPLPSLEAACTLRGITFLVLSTETEIGSALDRLIDLSHHGPEAIAA